MSFMYDSAVESKDVNLTTNENNNKEICSLGAGEGLYIGIEYVSGK